MQDVERFAYAFVTPDILSFLYMTISYNTYNPSIRCGPEEGGSPFEPDSFQVFFLLSFRGVFPFYTVAFG